MTARDLEKAVQQCPLLVPCAEVAALLDHRIVTGEHSIPREPMSLLCFGRLPEERVRYRLQSEWRKQPENTRYRILTRIVLREPMWVIRSLYSSLACGSPSRLDVSFAEAAVQR